MTLLVRNAGRFSYSTISFFGVLPRYRTASGDASKGPEWLGDNAGCASCSVATSGRAQVESRKIGDGATTETNYLSYDLLGHYAKHKNLRATQKLLRHSSISSTTIYADVMEEEMQESVMGLYQE